MSDPSRSRPRVLLTSVFGPFARDDEFGSRAINPLELYHNQVTRAQGPFSLRMHHRSWGIMLIMDENFLLYKRRVLELLDLMKRQGNAWSMFVFSSANAIRKYEMRQLVELGVSWVWMGFESAHAGYRS